MKHFDFVDCSENYAANVAIYDMINSGELRPEELRDCALIDEYAARFRRCASKDELCADITRKASRNIHWFG